MAPEFCYAEGRDASDIANLAACGQYIKTFRGVI